MLFLYHGTTSVYAIKVRLVLEEKALQWDGKILNLQSGEQFTPEYLKLNPKAVIPTLVHDGKAVIESTIIMEYLEDSFPDVPLMPLDTYLRSRVRLWMREADDFFDPCYLLTSAVAFRHYFMTKVADRGAEYIGRIQDPAKRKKIQSLFDNGLNAPEAKFAFFHFRKLAEKMNAALQRSKYLVGNEYSLADAALMPFLNRMEMLGLDAVWPENFPHLALWTDRLRNRPSYGPAVSKFIDRAAIERYDVPREEIAKDVRNLMLAN